MQPNGEIKSSPEAASVKVAEVEQPLESKKSKVWIFLLTGLLAAALGVAVVGFMVGKELLSPVTPGSSEKVVITIPGGASTGKVAAILTEQRLIKNDRVFSLYARFQGLDNKLKAGEYQFSPAMSVQEIVDALTKGVVTTYTFTIPEGYNTKQIAKVLVDKGYVNDEKFWQAVEKGNFEYDFLKGLPNGRQRLEGYLFPATYKITKGMTEEQIIDRMLKRFSQEITPEYKAKADKLGLTLHEAVTLASIIEREAVADEERPKVAAVFLNRIKKGMKLESCATVQYALGENKTRLLYKDLRIDSPYNTYLIKGLPVGPIANAGSPSLQAAVNPADVDYLFFVVSVDGKHAFSKTLAEHNRNKEKYIARFQTP
ncbi:MAG: endolytic transglycosylase MltG [Clostridia bacterium]|nr:endolytic transglycosylase MltG [Clostridia bacterium]